jgi:hypothetical protein
MSGAAQKVTILTNGRTPKHRSATESPTGQSDATEGDRNLQTTPSHGCRMSPSGDFDLHPDSERVSADDNVVFVFNFFALRRVALRNTDQEAL